MASRVQKRWHFQLWWDLGIVHRLLEQDDLLPAEAQVLCHFLNFKFKLISFTFFNLIFIFYLSFILASCSSACLTPFRTEGGQPALDQSPRSSVLLAPKARRGALLAQARPSHLPPPPPAPPRLTRCVAATRNVGLEYVHGIRWHSGPSSRGAGESTRTGRGKRREGRGEVGRELCHPPGSRYVALQRYRPRGTYLIAPTCAPAPSRSRCGRVVTNACLVVPSEAGLGSGTPLQVRPGFPPGGSPPLVGPEGQPARFGQGLTPAGPGSCISKWFPARWELADLGSLIVKVAMPSFLQPKQSQWAECVGPVTGAPENSTHWRMIETPQR